MSKEFCRGSEWRIWDLHLHSPETKLNDNFHDPSGVVWEKYCKILNDSDVHAFGIADYFSADGFTKTISEFK